MVSMDRDIALRIAQTFALRENTIQLVYRGVNTGEWNIVPYGTKLTCDSTTIRYVLPRGEITKLS